MDGVNELRLESRGDLRQMARQALDREYEAMLPALESLRISQEKLEEDISARMIALEEEIRASRKALEDEILASRRVLTDEVNACRRALTAIRTRSNSLSPAAMLPSDILALIFDSLALAELPGLASHQYRETPNAQHTILGWITVTHVCSRWRQVALYIPTLWREVTPELGFAWFNRILTRSQQTPISVTLCSTVLNSREKEYLDILTDHLPRMTSLTVSGHFDTISSWFFPRPVPQLHTLRLLSDWSVSALSPQPPPSYQFFNLPSTLREISFSNFLFSWHDIPAGQNLTRLTFTTYHTMTRTWSALECDKFLDFLKGSPNLEFLTLRNTFIGLDGQRPSSRIRLPRLSELFLREPWANVAWLLDHIEAPTWSKIHLHASTESNSLDNSMPLFFALASVLRSGAESPPSFQTMSMEYDNRGLCVAADTRSSEDGRGRPSFTLLEHDPPLLLRLSKPWRPTNTDTLTIIFQTIFDTLTTEGLRALSLDFRDSDTVSPLYTRGWAQILALFPSIVHLRVYGVHANFTFTLLGRHRRIHWVDGFDIVPATAEQQNVKPPLLPNLQSLDVRCINSDDRILFFGDPWYTRLLLALENRNSVLKKLEQLQVARCEFNEDQLRRLEAVVEEVVWDGNDGEPDEDYRFEERPDVWEDREGDDSDEEASASDESDGSDFSSSEDSHSEQDDNDAVSAAVLVTF